MHALEADIVRARKNQRIPAPKLTTSNTAVTDTMTDLAETRVIMPNGPQQRPRATRVVCKESGIAGSAGGGG